MRVGIADHFGWAVVVTASDDREVVDRRRIELIEPGVAAAPIEHDGKQLDDAAAAALVAEVRASDRADRVGRVRRTRDRVTRTDRVDLTP